MKTSMILLAAGLAGLGLALVVPWPSHGGAPAHPVTAIAIPAASTPLPMSAEKQAPTAPAPAGKADDQAIKALLGLNRELAAQYLKIQLDAQRNRDQWKQRWTDDADKVKAEHAAIDHKIQESEKEQAAMDAKIKQILADAKAEVEREKRELAVQAAAAANAPPPTHPKPGVTDF
jgi:hypothetical protein